MQHLTYASPARSSSSIKGDSERDLFVELWDVSGHERYKDCRSLFYSQINGLSSQFLSQIMSSLYLFVSLTI